MKKLLSVIAAVLISAFLSSCAGVNDWDYALPNAFAVHHINATNIYISYEGNVEGSVEGIPAFVKEFSYDERYVCTRNVETIEENDVSAERYYILDTKERITYGPYVSMDSLRQAAVEIGFEIQKYWYRTSSNPNDLDKSKERLSEQIEKYREQLKTMDADEVIAESFTEHNQGSVLKYYETMTDRTVMPYDAKINIQLLTVELDENEKYEQPEAGSVLETRVFDVAYKKLYQISGFQKPQKCNAKYYMVKKDINSLWLIGRVETDGDVHFPSHFTK